MVPNLLRLRANYLLKNGERAIFCSKMETGGLGDGSPIAGSRGGAPVGEGERWGAFPPEAEAVCAFYHCTLIGIFAVIL